MPGAGFVQLAGGRVGALAGARVRCSRCWCRSGCSGCPSRRRGSCRSRSTPVQNSPGTLPPAHLPGQSVVAAAGPPGVPPPEQVPGEPESRPPSGGGPGVTLMFECRCQSSGTAVPGVLAEEASRRGRTGAGVARVVVLAVQAGLRWRTKLCAQSAFQAASVPYCAGSKEKAFGLVAAGGAAPFTSRSRSSVSVLRNGGSFDRDLRPVGEDRRARHRHDELSLQDVRHRRAIHVGDREPDRIVRAGRAVVARSASTLIRPYFAVASLMHVMFELCVVSRAVTFSTSKSEMLRSVRHDVDELVGVREPVVVVAGVVVDDRVAGRGRCPPRRTPRSASP